MGSFFSGKIESIHLKFDTLSSTLSDIFGNIAKSWSGTWMDHFKPLSEFKVRFVLDPFMPLHYVCEIVPFRIACYPIVINNF